MNQNFTRNGKSIKPVRLIYIWVIIYVLITAGDVEKVFKLPYYFSAYRLLEMLYLLAIITSETFAIIGFFNKNPRAWCFTIALLVLASFKPLFTALIGQDYFENAFGDFLGTLVFTVPIFIYFIKNKPLFYKDAVNKPANKNYPSKTCQYNGREQIYNQNPYINSNYIAPDNNIANYSTTEPVLNGKPDAMYQNSRIKKYCKRCGKPLTDRDVGVCSNCGKKIR